MQVRALDEAGAVLLGRDLPAMLAVTARNGPCGALDLEAAGRTGIHVDSPHDGPVVPMVLSRLETALGAGDAADAWLSQALGRPARLVWLDDPGRRSMSAADMERFRPNVVVDGDLEPLVEDTWAAVRIGTVDFRVSELCDRCAPVTIDPQAGVRGQEPLRTLAEHRRWDGRTWFGARLVPEGSGTLPDRRPRAARPR